MRQRTNKDIYSMSNGGKCYGKHFGEGQDAGGVYQEAGMLSHGVVC